MERELKPHIEWGQLYSSTDFRDLFTYKKGTRTRSYKLRPQPDDVAELWAVTENRGEQRRSRKLVTFTNPEDTQPYLETVEQELRKGGWVQVG